MISYLKGKILKKTNRGLILDIGNIGYFIFIAKTFLSKIKEKENLEIFVHQQIREDASDLYGFENFEELEFFKKLISIKGIGPKVSLEIMAIPQAKVIDAVLSENLSFLSKIPGIGKKTAQRLILELKGELASLENTSSTVKLNDDIFSALTKLGYERRQINDTLKNLPDELIDEQEIISYFLRHV